MCLAYQLSHSHNGVTGDFVDEALSIPGGGATRKHRLGKEPHSISSMMLLKNNKLRLSGDMLEKSESVESDTIAMFPEFKIDFCSTAMFFQT